MKRSLIWGVLCWLLLWEFSTGQSRRLLHQEILYSLLAVGSDEGIITLWGVP